MIINLTPHPVTIGTVTIPPSGEVARVDSTECPAGDFGGIPLITSSFGEVTGLPDPQGDTLYIVSGMVRSAVPTRNDIASPSGLIRNDSGQVVGCSHLTIN